jgi:hypothetical protein
MIVVVGSPVAAADGASFTAAGLAALTAINLAAKGESVELIGRVGSDAAGDAIVLALGRAGVGHAALLRDAARSTPMGDTAEGIALDSGDLQLALRYLTAFDAAIFIAPVGAPQATGALLGLMRDGAAFAGARLIVVAAENLEAAAAGAEDPDTLHIVPGSESTAELAARLAARAIA